jgi:hypothetical protein
MKKKKRLSQLCGCVCVCVCGCVCVCVCLCGVVSGVCSLTHRVSIPRVLLSSVGAPSLLRSIHDLWGGTERDRGPRELLEENKWFLCPGEMNRPDRADPWQDIPDSKGLSSPASCTDGSGPGPLPCLVTSPSSFSSPSFSSSFSFWLLLFVYFFPFHSGWG